MDESKKPRHVIRAGSVSASIWESKASKDGREFPVWSIRIERSYKKGEEWNRTSSYGLADLPKVETVARKAYEALILSDGKAKDDQ